MEFNTILTQTLWLFYLLPIQYKLSSILSDCFIKKVYRGSIIIMLFQFCNIIFKWNITYKWNWLIKCLNMAMGPIHTFILGVFLAILLRLLVAAFKYRKDNSLAINVIMNVLICNFMIWYVVLSDYLKIPLIK